MKTSQNTPVVPVLFRNRRKVAPVLASQYVGTDTEIDVK